MNEITFKEIVSIILFKPTTEIDLLLNQPKFKHVYIFPVLYGIFLGMYLAAGQVGLSNLQHLISVSIGSILSKTLFVVLFCFIYSWLVLFISNSLQGTANFNMTFGLMSYSMIPMVIGSILHLVFFLIGYSCAPLIQSDAMLTIMIRFIFLSQFVFVLWSVFILVIGNAFINSFSMTRSLISSAGLIILFAAWIIFRK
ncbi:MAG: YIP1 family protein [Bacteroidia bacterium]